MEHCVFVVTASGCAAAVLSQSSRANIKEPKEDNNALEIGEKQQEKPHSGFIH